MPRILALAAVLALALVPACGGGDSDTATGTVAAGPPVLAIPDLPTGASENLLVGFRNLSTLTATVFVRSYQPDGTPYLASPTTVVLPPQGGDLRAISTLTGGFVAGGWIEVETRDINTLDGAGNPTPTPTTGFVAVYAQRFTDDAEVDATSALAFRSDSAFVNLTERTLSYQIINRGPAASFTVTTYDEFGVVLSSVPVAIPAKGSASALGSIITGRVEVVPVGAVGVEPVFGIASRERNPAAMIEGRFLDVPRGLIQRDSGYDLDFGTDVFGNVYDFAFVLTNPSTTAANVQLRGIYRRSDGFDLLGGPTVISVNAKSTKYLATNYADSRGLENLEINPFAEIFTDIAAGFETFFVDYSAPADIAISAREFPAKFATWFRILPGRKLTTDAIVLGVDVPSEINLGVRNFISLMNPGTSDRVINVRGFTPGGTEYLLGDIVVGPQQTVDWSPDGNIWRENPTDVTGPAVPFMAFRFTSNGGIYVDGRRIRYGPVTSEILSMRPHAWRDLRAE